MLSVLTEPTGAGAVAPAGEEAALLAALQAGDPAAFERLVREATPRLLATTRRYLKNEQDAQDAVQEAFVSAFRAIHRFEGNARLSTWLHRIAVNAALMRIRSRARRPEDSIDDLLPRFQPDGHHEIPAAAWPASLDEELGRRQHAATVRAAIDQLPDSYRVVLVLRDIEELDTDQTAELLGINPGAVKTRLHRARQALRTLLAPALQEAG